MPKTIPIAAKVETSNSCLAILNWDISIWILITAPIIATKRDIPGKTHNRIVTTNTNEDCNVTNQKNAIVKL